MISDPHTKRTVVIQNKEIPLWIYGDEMKEKILFIHGMGKGFSEYVGDLPVRYLKEKYCVVTFDLPGYGFSKGISSSNNEFIQKIIDELAIEKCFLFGVSYGSAVSLLFSLQNERRVKGVIVAGLPWASIPILISFLYAIKMIPPLLFRTIREFVLLRKNIINISVPVLLLYSRSDRLATVKMGRGYKSRLKNSRLCIISQRTHGWLMHKINENDFLPEIEKFIKDYS